MRVCITNQTRFRPEEWFDPMDRLEVEPDELSYNAVINAHARPRNTECAELERMHRPQTLHKVKVLWYDLRFSLGYRVLLCIKPNIAILKAT